MKERFTTLMTTLILSVFFSVSASAYDVEVDGIYYNYIAEGEAVEVTYGDIKYTGDIVIPESTSIDDNGLIVSSIGESAFEGCSGLTSVTIPNSITKIGKYAFYECRGLTSVTISDAVKSIGEAAFYCCSGLTYIYIPNSVTSIGASAFYDCSGLTSITIPDSITTIEDLTFNGCI